MDDKEDKKTHIVDIYQLFWNVPTLFSGYVKRKKRAKEAAAAFVISLLNTCKLLIIVFFACISQLSVYYRGGDLSQNFLPRTAIGSAAISANFSYVSGGASLPASQLSLPGWLAAQSTPSALVHLALSAITAPRNNRGVPCRPPATK